MQKLINLLCQFLLITLCFNIAESNAKNLFSTSENKLQDGLYDPYVAPEIIGINSWINSQPLKISQLKGKIVLIDFWTYSCINCLRTLPYITKWDQDYRDKGLVIIGIHAPEFEFEKNLENVKKAVSKYNIKYSVALDNNLATWTSFQNHFWPAHYLIDKNGQVVYTHFGEGNYQQTENNIRQLLGLNKKSEQKAEESTLNYNQTPETYLGYLRAANFANEQHKIENDYNFTAPKNLDRNDWSLNGKWKIEKERIIAKEAGAKLQINFTSKKVFLVLGTKSAKSIKAELKLNGQNLYNNAGKDVTQSSITVKNYALYELVNQHQSSSGLLEITAQNSGLEAYAFTFGN